MVSMQRTVTVDSLGLADFAKSGCCRKVAVSGSTVALQIYQDTFWSGDRHKQIHMTQNTQ